MGDRVVRILVDRLAIVLEALQVTDLGSEIPEELSLEIQVVRFDILGMAFDESFSFALQKL